MAPSNAASNTMDAMSAFWRNFRARLRASTSFSSMHPDKLPISLMDTHLGLIICTPRNFCSCAPGIGWPNFIQPKKGISAPDARRLSIGSLDR
jgi:hypothetical protein